MAGFGGSAAVAAVRHDFVHVCRGGHCSGVACGAFIAFIAFVCAYFVSLCCCHHCHVAGFSGSASIASVHVVCGGHHSGFSVLSGGEIGEILLLHVQPS